MSWAVGYDANWHRDIGYGVPAECDHPYCHKAINRGLAYVCANEQPYGGETGCGLYFCDDHLLFGRPNGPHCARCVAYKAPYKHPKPDTTEWLEHKAHDESWQQWRDENSSEVRSIIEQLKSRSAKAPDAKLEKEAK
jgi:hypothetical protein